MLSYTQTGTSSLCPGLDLRINTVFYIHTCCKLPPPAPRLAHIQPLLAGLPPYHGLRSQLICRVRFCFPLSFFCSVLMGRESLHVSYHPTITLGSDASVLLMNTVWHSFFYSYTGFIVEGNVLFPKVISWGVIHLCVGGLGTIGPWNLPQISKHANPFPWVQKANDKWKTSIAKRQSLPFISERIRSKHEPTFFQKMLSQTFYLPVTHCWGSLPVCQLKHENTHRYVSTISTNMLQIMHTTKGLCKCSFSQASL